MYGVSFCIEWTSLANWSYRWDWWLRVSWGRGTCAGHASITLVGVSFVITAHWPDR